MRADLDKVPTEQPRRGSDARNLKTRARFKDYDDGDVIPAGLGGLNEPGIAGRRGCRPASSGQPFTSAVFPLPVLCFSRDPRVFHTGRVSARLGQLQ
jgi:hypothetical protein